MQQKGWWVRKKRTGTGGVILRRTQVEYRFRSGVGIIVQKTEQATNPEGRTQPQESIAGKFEEVTAGYISHALPFHRMAFMAIRRRLVFAALGATAALNGTEGEILLRGFANYLIGTIE